MVKGTRKPKFGDLAATTDPKAPFDAKAFLAASRPVLKALVDDLLARSADEGVAQALTERHEGEVNARRTADPFEVWRRRTLTQVACHWLLSLVFVRTLEDRGLLDRNRIAGPGAVDSQKLFFQFAPYLTERDYLLTVFRELTRIPAAAALFDPRHNLAWRLAPSAETARTLLQLFRTPDAEAPAFRFGQSDTRFLGDLYQDLDDDVRERYALLQTPRFVESFILDRTLEESIKDFGLDETTLLDPTCGSGHFLLGAFERLYEHRLRAEPGIDVNTAVEKALKAVHGTDINPYSIAIARFRLSLAAWEKCGVTSALKAPVLSAVAENLAAVDSLLFRVGTGQLGIDEQASDTWLDFRGAIFGFEDLDVALPLLKKRFSVVVGNPPYITVKDAALRDEYRKLYRESASGKYSLAAPFAQRFFELARPGGYVGQITANSFMKREFGKSLIEKYLSTVNLELIVNTSGAYIPGHGTPTVLLFGRHESPRAAQVQAVLAKRGEPSTPEQPENGLVWRSIADHWKEGGFDNDYISVSKVERSTLNRHPWSLGGGGAAELKELLEDRCQCRLGDIADSIGISCVTGEDDVFMLPADAAKRLGIEKTRPMVVGESIRDWSLQPFAECVFPYNSSFVIEPIENFPAMHKLLWRAKAVIQRRKRFGVPMVERGLTWYELQELYGNKLRGSLTITFAEVATHNHFVLDRGGNVFKQSAPIIKLREGATEDEHLALLAYLNSSTACFWMKQVFQTKNSAEHGHHPDAERNRFQFAGTGMEKLPMPPGLSSNRFLAASARALMEIAAARHNAVTQGRTPSFDPTGDNNAAKCDWQRADELREQMVVLQEQIDWEVYALFGIAPSDATRLPFKNLKCRRGDRPFERVMPRKSFLRREAKLMPVVEGEVASATILSSELEDVWVARQSMIRLREELGIIEQALYKRQWRDTDSNTSEYQFRANVERELASAWADEQLESAVRGRDCIVSAAEILVVFGGAWTARVTAQGDSVAVSADWRDALAENSVPYLAALRYSATGDVTRGLWEETWRLQRLEDAGELVDVPMPPKFAATDFANPRFWSLRGKLDVPKERFISYPGCEGDEDKSPVYGWAGWNHLQQAQALASLYQKRKTEEGWGKERLTPMLAGIEELVPWVKQWHNEPNEEFGGLRLGDYFASFVEEECRALELTKADLKAWRPEAKQRGKAKPKLERTGAEDIEQRTAARKPDALTLQGSPPNVPADVAVLAQLVAILYQAGGRISRAELARAFTLLYLPKQLAGLAGHGQKGFAKSWAAAVKGREYLKGYFGDTLRDYDNSVFRCSTERNDEEFVALGPATMPESDVHAWYKVEAQFALDRARAMTAEVLKRIKSAAPTDVQDEMGSVAA